MLVLSRRPEQAIVFPNLGITVRILNTQGTAVKLGIDAPPSIKVQRHELIKEMPTAAATPPQDPRRVACHELCNQLSRVMLSLHLLEKQSEAGQHEQARQTLASALAQLEKLDREWIMAHLADPLPVQPMPPAPIVAIKPRTLVVDDDANERELLAGLLRMNGCDCETVGDGEDAMAYLDTHDRPDFVLLDMLMPRCDGPQTITRIRRDPRHRDLKVFSISGTCPTELGVGSGPEGVDAWFPKPLNPRKLWQAMEKSLNRPIAVN
jgi:carbon storage regulator CsrA